MGGETQMSKAFLDDSARIEDLTRRLGEVVRLPVHRAGRVLHDEPGPATAERTGEIAGERQMSGHASSLFSYWLAQALGGAADLNGDHVVTAKELFAFVSEKVKTESQGAQQPRYRLPAQAAEQALGGQ